MSTTLPQNRKKPSINFFGDATGKKILSLLEKETPLLDQKRRIEEAEQKAQEELDANSSNAVEYVNKNQILYEGASIPSHLAASLTSTAVTFDEDKHKKIREQRTKQVVRITKKGLGKLNIELHCDLVPKTCDNFIQLCKKGYYDGVSFHRLIPGFMIQGGDPTGTGKGGNSIWNIPFNDEFYPTLSHSAPGILSMANSGPNTNRSQFFITFAACTHLDRKHSVFGRVVGGLNVLKEMEKVPVDKHDRPTKPLQIIATTVYQDPFEEVRKGKEQPSTATTSSLSADPKSLPPPVEKKGDDESERSQNMGGAGVKPLHSITLPPKSTTSKAAPVGKYLQDILKKRKANKNAS